MPFESLYLDSSRRPDDYVLRMFPRFFWNLNQISSSFFSCWRINTGVVMFNKFLFSLLSLGLVACTLVPQSAQADNNKWDRNQWRCQNGYGNFNNNRFRNNYDRNHHGNYQGYYNNNNNHNWQGRGNGRFGGYDPNLNTTIDNRQARINTILQQGLGNGRLTQSEYNRLVQRQSQIDAMQTRFNTDGRLSFSERQRLSNQANQLQAQLWREMNDRNNRNRWY